MSHRLIDARYADIPGAPMLWAIWSPYADKFFSTVNGYRVIGSHANLRAFLRQFPYLVSTASIIIVPIPATL